MMTSSVPFLGKVGAPGAIRMRGLAPPPLPLPPARGWGEGRSARTRRSARLRAAADWRRVRTFRSWCARRDSNARPLAPEANALSGLSYGRKDRRESGVSGGIRTLDIQIHSLAL